MKKHKSGLSFLCGLATMAILVSLAGTALAASGAVTFNTANVSVNGKILSAKDTFLKTAGGASIPSTILYTDEQGGKTNYIPLRAFAEAFDMRVSWDGESDTVDIFVGGEAGIPFMPLSFPGMLFHDVQKDGEPIAVLKEVEPIPTQTGKVLLAETLYQGKETFTKELPLAKKAGDYVSITITNHGDKPLIFGLGRRFADDSGAEVIRTQIPAQTTVTRTLQVIDAQRLEATPIYMEAGNLQYVTRPIDVTVSAVQFSK